MWIDTIQLKEFSAFADATISLSPGVNVFIGANGTGKSHVMKVAYAALSPTG